MRTAALRGLGGYRDFDGPEDYDLWLRALRRRAAASPSSRRRSSSGATRPGRLTRTRPALRAPSASARSSSTRSSAARCGAARPVVVWGAGPIGKALGARARRRAAARVRGLRGGGPAQDRPARSTARRSCRCRGGRGLRRRAAPRRGRPAGRARARSAEASAAWASRRTAASSASPPDALDIIADATILRRRARWPLVVACRAAPSPKAAASAAARSRSWRASSRSRTGAPPAATSSTRLLRDADRGVRRRAALAAGRIGDPPLVPAARRAA